MELFSSLPPGPGYDFDAFYQKPGLPLIGIDEVGRGPLAGPVVTAAVVLDPLRPLEGLNDSKQLNERQREKLLPQILERTLHLGVGMSFPEEIDRVNIFQATIMAMRRALAHTRLKEGILLIDGLSFACHPLTPVKVIKGDTLSPSIMAASIVAKIIRDRLMTYYHLHYPQYDFAKHKGYGTKTHREAIRAHGPSPLHRMSFKLL